MKKFRTILAVAICMLAFNMRAQESQYVYGPINGINLDDMFAIGEKTFDKNGVKTEVFNYSKGVLTSSNFNFTVLINEYRCNIEIKNTDKGIYLSFVNLQMKSSNGTYQDIGSIMGKKPDKLIHAIGSDFETISKDPDQVKTAKINFYNKPHTHFLFFQKATDLAADRWYGSFMKDRSFAWLLEFSDIKKNETGSCQDKPYVVTAKYQTGTSLMGSGGLFVRLYTNDDKYTMTDKGSRVEIEGKCIGFNKDLGVCYIDFIQE